jgi:tyrosine-specific transport protein
MAMVGTIIGAGIFGLPAAFSAVGFVPGTILFFFLTIVVLLTHLIFAEQLLATRERHRLSGMAQRGLGEFAFELTAVTYPLQILGANYAYLVLGGEFLDVLARAAGIHIPIEAWQLLFWIAGALTVLLGLKAIANAETVLSSIKIMALMLVVLLALPLVDVTLQSRSDWLTWFLPFGIFLFALSGVTGIGEVIDIAGRNRRAALWAVGGGTVLSAVLCWLFGVTLFFAAHGYPIRTAADLASVLPNGTGLIIPLLGFLAVAGAYLITAQDLRITFNRDLGWKPFYSNAVALLMPVVLLAVLTRDFLAAIGFVGAVLVGMNSLIVCALGYKAMFRKRDHVTHLAGTAICALLIGVYVFGILQYILSRQAL